MTPPLVYAVCFALYAISVAAMFGALPRDGFVAASVLLGLFFGGFLLVTAFFGGRGGN